MPRRVQVQGLSTSQEKSLNKINATKALAHLDEAGRSEDALVAWAAFFFVATDQERMNLVVDIELAVKLTGDASSKSAWDAAKACWGANCTPQDVAAKNKALANALLEHKKSHVQKSPG